MAPRKRPGGDAVEGGGGGKKSKKEVTATTKGGAKSTISKGKNALSSDVQTSPSRDLLLSLPPELLSLVLDQIIGPSNLNALSRTCKSLYTLMMPRLYKRIVVAAMFHAHIPILIRTLQPLLTTFQRKLLRKEGMYKGQQEEFPKGLDERAKSICANYVRQLIIGVADPGKKHRYIVVRYIEEAIRNLENLEVFETHVYTKDIGQSLSLLKHLKALSLTSSSGGEAEEDCSPLASITNLKHLNLQGFGGSGNDASNRRATHMMMYNSRTTLRSLVVAANMYPGNFFQDWEDNTASESNSANRFTALRSLSLSGIAIESDVISSLQAAFDFTKLKELSLAHFLDSDGLFLQYLNSLATPSLGKGRGLNLQTLNLSMYIDDYTRSLGSEDANFNAKCRLISSFDSLIELVLPDYGQYPEENAHNPGLSETLLQAILKHKNLKVLRIPYDGITSGLKVPYISSKTVASLVAGLPCLETFEFAPVEEEIDKIGSALSRSANLKTVTFFPYASWASPRQPDSDPEANIIRSVLKAFLSNEIRSQERTTDDFFWEDCYKLKKLMVSRKTIDIASKFGKGGKGVSKPEKFEVYLGQKKHEVMYRDVTPKQVIHIGYDPEHPWVRKVEDDH